MYRVLVDTESGSNGPLDGIVLVLPRENPSL